MGINFLLNKKADCQYRSAFFICFFGFIFLFSTQSTFALRKKSFPMLESMRQPLTTLLNLGTKLHQSSYYQDGKSDLWVLKIIKQAKVVKILTTRNLSRHEYLYMNKLLDGLVFHVEQFKRPSNYRMQYINAINRKLIAIRNNYDLRKEYTVYFCRSDRNAWLQKDGFQKPLHSVGGIACGTPVIGK